MGGGRGRRSGMSTQTVAPFNEPRTPVPSDLEIAQEAPIEPIVDVALRAGLTPRRPGAVRPLQGQGPPGRLGPSPGSALGKYIDVTAITPTPLGEGKTTTVTVGLSQGLGRHGQEGLHLHPPAESWVQPSASRAAPLGGGYSQVIPMEDFNLHLTGDLHAVTIGPQPARRPRSTTTSTTATRSTSTRSTISWPRVAGSQRSQSAPGGRSAWAASRTATLERVGL